jgi:outer membrane protein assembly factor BamD
MEIVQPTGNQSAPTKPGNTAFPGTQPADSGDAAPQQAQPAATQPNAQTARPNPADNGGLTPSGPPANAQLAPVEHADKAPEPVNEAQPSSQPQQAQTADNSKKKPKPAYDSNQESSSKKKPKKGLKKLNPF